jgi:hypothetical protein
LKARIASRALVGAGLVLAWLGLLLPWEQWRTSAADGSVGGLDASRLFWVVLAVATVLALLAVWREWSWAFVALAVAALVLVGFVVREMGASAAAGSAFVSVAPGAGAIVALIGAAALLAAVILALRPPALQLGAGLAVFALVTGGAAAWPQDDGRPADGAIGVFAGGSGGAMAFQGDTLYVAAGGELIARPAPGREYEAVRVTSSDDVDHLVFAGDTAYVALSGIDRLVAVGPDVDPRILVAAEDFHAGPLAAGPDGSVYVLQGDSIVRWRDGEVRTLAPRFGGARAIAADARGALFVADTANGRVHRVDPDGSVETVVGTDAPRDCLEQGLDDPLALDPARCTAVQALAVDGAGNLYLALKNAGMIVGLTPEGRMGVVAGTGPKGVGETRLGVVEALAAGPDGDLYVSESDPVERVRRIADPAGLVASEPPEPEPPGGGQACAEIAALSVAATRVGETDALESALNALAGAAPEELLDEVDALAAGATGRRAAELAVRRAVAGGKLGAYAEEECGLVGGYAVTVEEANAFCLAYARYRDQGELAEAGEAPPRALRGVVAAAPAFLAGGGRDALRQLESAAGRAVPEAEAARMLAGIEAVEEAASAMCVAA